MDRVRERIKVLSLGIGQSNFLMQLYSQIKLTYKDITFDIDDFKKLGKTATDDQDVSFSEYFDFKKGVTRIEIYIAILKNLFHAVTMISLLQIFFSEEKNKFRQAKKHIFSFGIAKAVVDKYLRHSEYDIYHFHFCVPFSINYLFFFPKHSKIICSFWGSDLLRFTGLYNTYLQGQALKRADVITTHSHELSEIILARFGRSLKPKIRFALFSIETKLYDLIDAHRNNVEEVAAFKERFAINTEYVIVIGNNASPYNNHFKILNQVDRLDSDTKKKITCILPLTYSDPQWSYVNEIQAYCNASDVNCLLIREFLSWDDLALLKLSTDIMINMPETDALSGAATEAMYAGNLVLTGAWLPYKIFQKFGLHYKALDSFSEITELIDAHLNKNRLISDSQANENRENIRKYLFPSATVKPWVKIYNTLVYGEENIQKDSLQAPYFKAS